MDGRNDGLDLARALAVVGLILVDFELALTNRTGADWLATLSTMFDGRATALLVLVAGAGLTLFSRRESDGLHTKVAARAVALIGLGYFFAIWWDLDVVHYIGVYYLLGLVALRVPSAALLVLATGTVAAFGVVVALGFDFDEHWVLDYSQNMVFWEPSGLARNLFLDGYFPVLPWMGFFLVGMWIGRLLLDAPTRVRRLALPALVIAVAAESVAVAFGGSEGGGARWLSTAPMPPMPLYAVAACAEAIATLGLCLVVADRFRGAAWLSALVHAGQLALTIYLAHVLLGIGPFDLVGRLHSLTLARLVVWWLVFSATAIVLADVWRGRYERGPLEGLLRRVPGA